MKTLSALFLSLIVATSALAEKPHAVFVVGTPHYDPQKSMPPLAKQLKKDFGWKTTVIMPEGNPEKDPKGIAGLEKLAEADVAIFYLRFLTLPPEQLKHITDYLESGKPVVGLRTSTHAFIYPKDHPLAKWNNDFGARAMGTQYFAHLQGTTQVSIADGAAGSDLLIGYPKEEQTAEGVLYLSKLPKDATVLLRGTGKGKKEGPYTNQFGTVELKKIMTQDVAWTWKNEWGGRVFGTTLGHSKSFENAAFVRLLINGIHWAAGEIIPAAEVKVKPITPTSPKKKIVMDAGIIPKDTGRDPRKMNKKDAKNVDTGKKVEKDPELAKYAWYEKDAPNPTKVAPVETSLPLQLKKGDRIAYIGNTLLDRAGDFGYFETLIQQAHPDLGLTVRNLSWSADEVDLQPRPDNFASLYQHLTLNEADVIFAAFGYNESFAGVEVIPVFQERLTKFLVELKSSAFNGKTGPRIVLLSPVANENAEGVPGADLNNERLAAYTEAMREVAAAQKVGFADVFRGTRAALDNPDTDLTINGAHLNDGGYQVFAEELFRETFGESAPEPNEQIRQVVLDKNTQFFYRYRPLNTFYYTGDRNKAYGYLDFLPAMRNFDAMVKNRDARIHALAAGKAVPDKIDDSNVPPMPPAQESRGANEWLSPADELAAFQIDPRFEVNIFASEEQFPDIACPIQMRWDAQGRLWVACSTTYPHVYPGNKPNDKIVILEDTDWDGKADKSTVFADDVNIPLSFVLGDGGVYVSEEPHFTFLKDTDGDGKADYRRHFLTGFGTEDSHHALHDMTWTPDGDLLFRESIFHNSQVETAYGPIRAKNSAWFRYRPKTQKLVTFGAYPNTNPWGVTYSDWGHHVASHPIFASAFHALNPPYPEQHPKAAGIPAYSGVAGHEFVDFPMWPEELQGGFIKNRYKPTNRVEIHRWVEKDDHYTEEYAGDLIFSTNLSFIPVDLRYGPRGAMYICDWYNPVKGHAQYSLRDPRRDRKSGRIFRVVPKGAKLQDPPEIAGATIEQLLKNLERREYRYRYWSKRELRERDEAEVATAIGKWITGLDSGAERFRHHQVEAIWALRTVNAEPNAKLLREVLTCGNHNARAAATRQLRYWHAALPDALDLLKDRAGDENGIVRMEAAIAASYIGTEEALAAIQPVFDQPMGDHLKYAVRTSLGSEALSRHWQGNQPFLDANPAMATFMAGWDKHAKLATSISVANSNESGFDSQKNLKTVEISCVPERMLYTVKKFQVKAGQPVKLVFTNPDVTQHNLVIVQPGAVQEVGMAGNEMAKDPEAAKRDFIPKSDKILHHTKLLSQDTGQVLRFKAPDKPGVYPYLCTFPGHWVIMNGEMIVK